MIIETRQLLADALRPIDWDVWMFEPSDVASVPCFVVGRPAFVVEGTGQGNLYTITNPVWVIGRRMGDEDAETELDVFADEAVEALKPVAAITALLPTIRLIADVSYPAYRIDCVTGQGRC